MKRRQSLFLVLLLTLCSAQSWGQSTATLAGTVTDPTGAVVANAHVSIHSLATGADREAECVVREGEALRVAVRSGERRTRRAPDLRAAAVSRGVEERGLAREGSTPRDAIAQRP